MPLVVMAPVPEAAPRAQPVLLAMATDRPEETVGIMVQKLVKDTSLEELVARLGGVITKDLHIISAFAAELPAKAVPALAKAARVRWVSLDAPVVQAGEPIDTSNLVNAYVQAIGANQLWNEAPYLQGQSVTVAVVDSGIRKHVDVKTRRVESVNFTDQNWVLMGRLNGRAYVGLTGGGCHTCPTGSG